MTWGVEHVSQLVTVVTGALTAIGLLAGALSIRSRLHKREQMYRELLQQDTISTSARTAMTVQRERVIAQIIAVETVSPLHFALVGSIVGAMSVSVFATGYRLASVTTREEFWDEGGSAWGAGPQVALMTIPISGAVVALLVHLALERVRVQDAVLLEDGDPVMRPRPRVPSWPESTLALGFPALLLGIGGILGLRPGVSYAPFWLVLLVLIPGLTATSIGFLKLFWHRLPAYLRQEEFDVEAYVKALSVDTTTRSGKAKGGVTQ